MVRLLKGFEDSKPKSISVLGLPPQKMTLRPRSGLSPFIVVGSGGFGPGTVTYPLTIRRGDLAIVQLGYGTTQSTPSGFSNLVASNPWGNGYLGRMCYRFLDGSEVPGSTLTCGTTDVNAVICVYRGVKSLSLILANSVVQTSFGWTTSFPASAPKTRVVLLGTSHRVTETGITSAGWTQDTSGHGGSFNMDQILWHHAPFKAATACRFEFTTNSEDVANYIVELQ